MTVAATTLTSTASRDSAPTSISGRFRRSGVALEVRKSSAPVVAKAAFLEELIIRRELSDNFCHYNENYDGIEGIHPWARATLDTHREDPREYIYTPISSSGAKLTTRFGTPPSVRWSPPQRCTAI